MPNKENKLDICRYSSSVERKLPKLMIYPQENLDFASVSSYNLSQKQKLSRYLSCYELNMQGWYIGITAASQAVKAGSTPVPCSINKLQN